MNPSASIAPSGQLITHVIRGGKTHVVDPSPSHPPLTLRSILEQGMPRKGLSEEVNRFRRANMRHLWRGAWRHLAAEGLGVGHMIGSLYAVKTHGDGRVVDYGLISMRVVTTAGVGFIVDAFQNIVELEIMKFHGYGTGTTAEAIGDTALVTELTTEYNPNSTRPTGTTVEGASANIYRTVATLTPDSGTPVLREHGIFSQAATGGGVLLDRTVFAAITLDSSAGDSLTTTYELTLTPGS